MSNLRLALSAVISSLLLTACETASFESNCPPIVEYTVAEQYRAADELEAMPDDSIIVRMMGDYRILRKQIRACE